MNQLNNPAVPNTEIKLNHKTYANQISDTLIRHFQDQYNYSLSEINLHTKLMSSNRNAVENHFGSASRIQISEESAEDDEINRELLRLTNFHNDQLNHLKKIQHELKQCTEEEVKLKSEFENVRIAILDLIEKHRESSSCWKCLIA